MDLSWIAAVSEWDSRGQARALAIVLILFSNWFYLRPWHYVTDVLRIRTYRRDLKRIHG